MVVECRILDWDFFLNWEKSHLNCVGKGTNLAPENTKKIPLIACMRNNVKTMIIEHRYNIIDHPCIFPIKNKSFFAIGITVLLKILHSLPSHHCVYSLFLAIYQLKQLL